jgi:hypothetical protein
LHGYHKGGDGGAAQNRADEEARNAKIKQNTADINLAFDGTPASPGVVAKPGFDDAYFANVADAYMAYQKPLLEEQAAVARRSLPNQFASTGSSAYQTQAANLERDYSRESSNLADKSLDFANQQRSTIENNRSDLIGMSNAGTDATSLATQTAARMAALSKPPAYSPIADLFSKYAATGANYAQANMYGNLNNAGGNSLYYGPSSSAVKTVR